MCLTASVGAAVKRDSGNRVRYLYHAGQVAIRPGGANKKEFRCLKPTTHDAFLWVSRTQHYPLA